jgi:hypothetical protein
MHLMLKQEATRPVAANALQQQARFDTFLERFNHQRPHQALAMKVPATSTLGRPYPTSRHSPIRSTTGQAL